MSWDDDLLRHSYDFAYHQVLGGSTLPYNSLKFTQGA